MTSKEKDNFVDLEAIAVSFYSSRDESAFFNWLESIPSVQKVEGAGLSLYITVDIENTDEESLRELIAIFWRYDISLKQLSIFDREEFQSWFKAEGSFWYEGVFS